MSLTANALTRTAPDPGPSWPWRFVSDLGGMALLLTHGVGFLGCRCGRDSTRRHMGRAILHNLGWMLGMGLPLVGLVHVSFGSFLTMQAYFGATFTEAAGIVVGLGLIRKRRTCC